MTTAATDEDAVVRRALWQWLRAFGTFALILVFDPFGCSTGADRYSENLLMKMAAPFHSASWSDARSPDSPGQKKVLVVLVDADTLREWEATRGAGRVTWPLSRTQQVDWLIAPLLRAQPASLLLDWTFHQDALGVGGEADSKAAREMLAAELEPIEGVTPTRLLLGTRAEADQPQPGCDVQWATPAGLNKRHDVTRRFSDWPVAATSGGAPAPDVELVSLLRYDRTHYQPFPLRLAGSAQEGCAPPEAGEPHLASPAVAMFRVFCEREGQAASTPTGTRALCEQLLRTPRALVMAPAPGAGEARVLYRYAAPPNLVHAMTLHWPGFRSSAQERVDAELARAYPASDYARYAAACAQSGEWPAVLFATLLWRAVSDGGRGEGCRYGIDWISFAQFDDLIATGKLDLAGRHVLVAPELPSVPDRAPSSLYGEAPGVFLHAVALENMISFGDRYLRDPPSPLPGLSVGTLITLIVGAIVALAVPRFSRLFEMHGLRVALPVAMAGLLLPIVIGAQLTACLGMAPIGWVSAIAASAWILDEFVESKLIRPACNEVPATTRTATKAPPARTRLRVGIAVVVIFSPLLPCGWPKLAAIAVFVGLLIWLSLLREKDGSPDRQRRWVAGFARPAMLFFLAAVFVAMGVKALA